MHMWTMTTMASVVMMLAITGQAGAEATIVDVERIWDRAPHNAFTDLIRFQDRWYCAFREGEGHVCDVGALRVLRSEDGKDWQSVAHMTWPDGDVRDAKLSITADGQLMLNGAVRFLEPQNDHRHQSVTWLSPDGETWSEAYACPTGLGTWRWSVTWHDDVGYSIGYSGKDYRGCLYRTEDGISWEPRAPELFPDDPQPGNETSLHFDPNGQAYCLLRDGPHWSAHLGLAEPPYTEWTWYDLGVRIGGPKLIRLDDGRFVASARLHDDPDDGGAPYTALLWLDPEGHTLTEFLRLPSGGDTSYAGLVEHEGLLWVSYYSSHEEKTAIYLARVDISPVGASN